MSDSPEIKKSGPLAFMAGHPVAANLLMFLLLAGGFAMLPQIRQEVLPSFELDVVQVRVTYPGASPAEVEQGVVLALEEAVRGLDGVDSVTSRSTEGLAIVSVSTLLGADTDRVLADVKSAVDRITSFPADAERPVVNQLDAKRKVVSLAVYGGQDEGALRKLAEDTRNLLLNEPSVSQVELRGVRERELSVEVPQAQLRRYNLTLADVARTIREGSVELPAGKVSTKAGEVLVRTSERRDTRAGLESLVVLAARDGSSVRLGDIATVRDGFAESGSRAQLDGNQAVILDVFRVGEQTPVEVSAAVQKVSSRLAEAAPAGVGYRMWDDQSQAFKGRRDLMIENAGLGLVLVLLVLGLFLDLRLAFWVTMGIPISFIGSMLIFPSFDVSVNMISLFAFIVALGMVVDDAIVAGESIYQRRQRGEPALSAAVAGIKDVAAPVTFSVLSTIVAFMPLLFVPGVGGKFLRNVPLIVIAVLAISLVESLFILPAHLAHGENKKPTGLMGWISRKQGKFARSMEWAAEHVYRPALRAALARRYLSIACGISMLIMSAGVVAGGHVGFSFLPKIDSDMITVSVRLPYGAPASETQAVVEHVESSARAVLERQGGFEASARGVLAEVGIRGDHEAEVAIQLTPTEERALSASELTRMIRAEVGDVAGVESMRFEFSAKGGPSGRPIDIELSHADMATLQRAASATAQNLAAFEGVEDVDRGYTLGKEQLDLRLTRVGQAAGVDAGSLARQLRASFQGEEALRQQRGRDEVRVMVRRPVSERRSEWDIQQTMIRTPEGAELPLTAAANVVRGRSFTELERKDGRRLLHVTADVDRTVASAGRVTAEMSASQLPQLAASIPGLSYEVAGARRAQNETNGALGQGFLLSLLGIFALLAIPFRSYLQPALVLSAIPFGFVGAVIGHWAMGYDLSLMSMMGLVALSGVVVNDSLVLVVGVNEARAQGASLMEALEMGGVRRFRPILLTSLTTFFGLAPMLAESSVQARFIIPMAISLGFGVMFATFITLLLVPAFYAVLEDARQLWARVWARGSEDTRDEEQTAGALDPFFQPGE